MLPTPIDTMNTTCNVNGILLGRMHPHASTQSIHAFVDINEL